MAEEKVSKVSTWSARTRQWVVPHTRGAKYPCWRSTESMQIQSSSSVDPVHSTSASRATSTSGLGTTGALARRMQTSEDVDDGCDGVHVCALHHLRHAQPSSQGMRYATLSKDQLCKAMCLSTARALHMTGGYACMDQGSVADLSRPSSCHGTPPCPTLPASAGTAQSEPDTAGAGAERQG
eukprot:1942591-Rhodomonas_salina.1